MPVIQMHTSCGVDIVFTMWFKVPIQGPARGERALLPLTQVFGLGYCG